MEELRLSNGFLAIQSPNSEAYWKFNEIRTGMGQNLRHLFGDDTRAPGF